MPCLPSELERIIFEMAALEDTDHGNRVRITLVAKRVYEWVRPILYRIAIVEGRLSTLTIRNWGNAQRTDVGRFVRHLLTTVSEESWVIELVSNFRNVENLAIWGYLSVSSKLLEEISDLPLHTFSAHLGRIDLDDAVKNCRAFRNLTHLEILGLQGPPLEDCNAFLELPKLTHLSFEHFAYVEEKAALDLLRCCSSLQVLMFARKFDSLAELGDPRHLVLRNNNKDEIGEWQRSANGQMGRWELADRIVEARKGKLFNDNFSCTFSPLTWMNDLNDDGVRWYKEWSEISK